SGFLITALLVEERDSTGRISLRDFYIRRALRLLPALFLLLAFCALYAAAFPEQVENHTFGRDALGTLFYVANWVQASVGHTEIRLLSHTWSLAVEEQFYVVWPLAFVALLRWGRSRSQMVAVVFAGIVASALVRWALVPAHGPMSVRAFEGLDSRGASGLLVGCLAGLLVGWKVLPAGRAATRAMRAAAVVGFAGLAVIFLGRSLSAAAITARPSRLLVVGLPAVAVCSALLIVGVVGAPGSVMARMLAVRPVAWVGRISYGLYLWHYPIDRMLRPGAHTLGLGHVPLQIVRVALAFGAATASFYLVEQPLLRRKRRFSPRAGTPRELPGIPADSNLLRPL
ncbi:MAG: acyltransferase, partial [Acidimicrobiia bacterium]|nr:acyltransferase [Acidimicrobiia bacterium]